jgi:hypothetical protein
MPSIVTRYANQTVTLERKSGTNDYGDASYDDPVTISARYEPRSGLRRSITGDEVAVESLVLTEIPLSLGDLVEGSSVRRVETIVDKSGRILGYQAYL